MIKKILKKALNFFLIILVIFSCVSCKKEKDDNKEKKEELPKIVNTFIEKTNAINEVTISSKDDLDLCIILYTCIEERYTDLLENESIVNAKLALDTKITKYNELKEDDYNKTKKQELVNNFLDSVKVLPSTNLIALEDLAVILNAEKSYNLLTDDLKEKDEVKTSKAILDNVRKEYDTLTSLDSDAYNAHKFVVNVSKLPSINDLTVNDITMMDEVTALYDSLTTTSKESKDVIDAKAILDTYNKKVTELKASKQKVSEFITNVFSLPNGSELKWKNAEQKAKIDACYTAYNSLTELEKTFEGVEDAYKALNTTKETFEALKEPYDISKIKPTHLCLYYYNGPKKLTFENGADPYTVLINNYGLTKETIKQNVKIFLDVYIEGGAIPGSPLFSFDITEDYGITMAMIVNKLNELKAAGDERIKSQGYNFTIHIESLNDRYGNSEYSSFFSAGNIPV